MTRKIFIMAWLMFLAMALHAQNPARAKQILDKTSSIVGRRGGASANFSIQGGNYEPVSGTIAIKGRKFYAQTPKGATWFNGKTQWTYLSKSGEVNVSNPDQSTQARMNPYQFITLYKQGYALGVSESSDNYLVTMKATTTKSNIREIQVTIDKASYLPKQVKMLQKGKWTTIRISNFKAKNLSDRLFNFPAKDYPKAEIIDLR
ncbi:MAG: LolA-like putative outer membrane lipoprotein chaperone [Prevotellaceae bacterium]|nr:LolA-like putative outer membrane lipoprotein chaperone [Prevotellaceae bacterium]MDY2634099.1 LolA-like putative outer membrane lipoprotein chaperone [Prevotella sp.]